MNPIDTVLDALRTHGKDPKRNGKGWVALCPGHDDHKPSLSIDQGDNGRCLLKCRSRNCPTKEIVRAIGLTMGDLFATGNRRAGKQLGKVVATYDYHDTAGHLLYQVLRYEPKDFRQRKPNPAGGHDWQLNGVLRVPYRLPQLLAAPVGTPVYVCEGEKDADNLAALDLIATTNAGGAMKWHTLDRSTVAKAFRNRHVVILPDNDEPGHKHADQVAKALKGIAADVRIVPLPELKEKGDVSDWLLDHTIAELEELAAATVPDTPTAQPSRWPEAVCVTALSETASAVDWTWHGCLARGHLTMVVALAKGGKTTLFSHLLRQLQEGQPFLDRPTQKTKTLVVSEESTAMWFRRRESLGLDNHLSLICRPMVSKPSYGDWCDFIDHVAGQAAARQCNLVVFDTISAFAPWRDENDAAAVQATMTTLNRLTLAGHTVLVFHHAGKADQSEGRSARGSSAFGGAVDVLLEMRRYKPDDRGDRRRVLTGHGRFDEVPDEIVIRLKEDGSGYTAEGDRKAVAARELANGIQDILPEDPPGMTAGEIHEAMPEGGRPRVGNVRNALREGATTGRWARTGNGKPPKDPWRFWRGER